jgi:hypothetical protein
MTLIRGVTGLFPCPVCLIPKDQQSNLAASYGLHTADDLRDTYKAALVATTKAESERLLKSKGLRPIEVCI